MAYNAATGSGLPGKAAGTGLNDFGQSCATDEREPQDQDAWDRRTGSAGALCSLLDAAAQRGRDNPALNRAIELGETLGAPVLAVFGLTDDYPGAQRRHYRFLVEGLASADADLAARGVPLVVRLGRPSEVVLKMAAECRPAVVVGDENPVRVGEQWRQDVARELTVPFELVDADVVVPSSLFPKQEYAARTIRPKIHKVLDEYLKPIPNPNADQNWQRA